MKKITLDTRVTVIINGEKITAPAHLLNLLSIYAGEAAYRYADFNCYCLRDQAMEMRDTLYDQLEARGLYAD